MKYSTINIAPEDKDLFENERLEFKRKHGKNVSAKTFFGIVLANYKKYVPQADIVIGTEGMIIPNNGAQVKVECNEQKGKTECDIDIL